MGIRMTLDGGSRSYSSLGPRQVRPFAMDAADVSAVAGQLRRFGIVGLTDRTVREMMARAMDERAAGVGMDDLQASITTASITSPIQFLQNWLPGFVNIMTAARNIDKLIGVDVIGDWEDEEVIQGIMEQLGTSVPYGDYTDIPFSSWNAVWERRSIVRFEEGMHASRLEEARAAKVKINSAEQKRESANLALEIRRNSVGFYGYNGGNNRTYGFLNDPALPAAVQFPLNGGATSRDWSQKTFAEIQKDIRLGMLTLRQNSLDNIDPYTTPITCALPTNEIDYLSVTTDYGQSVKNWAKETFPQLRFESAPELELAVGGVNVAYFYAEKLDDTSTDNKATWMQIVPAKSRLVGVQQMAKGYVEDWSNALAGVMLKRPFAVARFLFA